MVGTRTKEPRIKLNTIKFESHYLDDDLRKNGENYAFFGVAH